MTVSHRSAILTPGIDTTPKGEYNVWKVISLLLYLCPIIEDAKNIKPCPKLNITLDVHSVLNIARIYLLRAAYAPIFVFFKCYIKIIQYPCYCKITVYERRLGESGEGEARHAPHTIPAYNSPIPGHHCHRAAQQDKTNENIGVSPLVCTGLDPASSTTPRKLEASLTLCDQCLQYYQLPSSLI